MAPSDPPPDGITVLLVDSSASDALLTKRVYHDHCGYPADSLMHATNRPCVLTYLASLFDNVTVPPPVSLKLILMDLDISYSGSGMELLRQMKSSEGAKRIPVVVFTATGNPEERERCIALGVEDYIVKPMEYSLYGQTLSDVFHKWLAA